MLTYYINYINIYKFSASISSICDHSKRILTDWITQWRSTPNARGLVLSNVTWFHGTLFRVFCLFFGQNTDNRTSLKTTILYYRRRYCTPCTTVFLAHLCKPFVKLISFILTTNATMQVFTLRYLYMLAKGWCRDVISCWFGLSKANTATRIIQGSRVRPIGRTCEPNFSRVAH